MSDLRGASLELNDDEIIEKLNFMDDVRVVATLGTKKGAVCGPILRYRFLDDDSVEISGGDGAVLYRWNDLRMSDDVLTVECSGKTKIYRITRAPKKERYLP